MGIEHIFDSMSSVMTVVSFTTFLGIVWWARLKKVNMIGSKQQNV